MKNVQVYCYRKILDIWHLFFQLKIYKFPIFSLYTYKKTKRQKRAIRSTRFKLIGIHRIRSWMPTETPNLQCLFELLSTSFPLFPSSTRPFSLFLFFFFPSFLSLSLSLSLFNLHPSHYFSSSSFSCYCISCRLISGRRRAMNLAVKYSSWMASGTIRTRSLVRLTSCNHHCWKLTKFRSACKAKSKETNKIEKPFHLFI